MKTVTRVEDLLRVPSREVDGPILWIDDATGKIVDRSSHPRSGRAVDEAWPKAGMASRQRLRDASRVFVDLVGTPPQVTIEHCRPVKRMRLPLRVVRLLPAKGGG